MLLFQYWYNTISSIKFIFRGTNFIGCGGATTRPARRRSRAPSDHVRTASMQQHRSSQCSMSISTTHLITNPWSFVNSRQNLSYRYLSTKAVCKRHSKCSLKIQFPRAQITLQVIFALALHIRIVGQVLLRALAPAKFSYTKRLGII